MKVRCERDGTEFEATPRTYTYSKEYAEVDGYKHPVQVIDCPTCFRGYFLEVDGTWMSDRSLTILKE